LHNYWEHENVMSHLNSHFKGNYLNKRGFSRLIKKTLCNFPHKKKEENRIMLKEEENIFIGI